jgi:hypothetical protein
LIIWHAIILDKWLPRKLDWKLKEILQTEQNTNIGNRTYIRLIYKKQGGIEVGSVFKKAL